MTRLNKEDYPLTLSAMHIKAILDIGQRQTYELLKDPPFHVTRVGVRYFISRNVFFKWLEGSEYQNSHSESNNVMQKIGTPRGSEMKLDKEMIRKMKENRLIEYKHRLFTLEMDKVALQAIGDEKSSVSVQVEIESLQKSYVAVEGME